MNRILSCVLLAALVLSLFGGSASPARAENADAPLYLKASSITFSLVGEQDDIYLGVAPREQVTWRSDDPSVVSVEDGVLTAVGIGSTTIYASCGDQEVSCKAGCLAQTQEELDALDYSVVTSPKRLPPDFDLTQPCHDFDNAAIVGDSITYFLLQWESKTNYLGDILFLARGGVSMNGLVLRFKNIYYRGREAYLEDAIAASGVERVYFLMGSNDIASTTQRPYLRDNWYTLVGRIREKSPNVEIVLLSNIPLYDEEPKSTQNDVYVKAHNDLVEEYNVWLRQFAEENDCMFIDLAYYVQDHYNRMPEIYNQGSYHMNELGCLNWMKILRYYVQFEHDGGTLS